MVFKNVVRNWGGTDVEISVHNEARTGIDDIFNYMSGNMNFARAKFLIEKGSSLEDALKEEGYEK